MSPLIRIHFGSSASGSVGYLPLLTVTYPSEPNRWLSLEDKTGGGEAGGGEVIGYLWTLALGIPRSGAANPVRDRAE